jgi:hypothetical protein
MAYRFVLKEKHIRFAHLVARGEEKWKAYQNTISLNKKAGKGTSSVGASKLLERPEIQDLIKQAQKEQQEALFKAQSKQVAAEFKTYVLAVEELDAFHSSVIQDMVDVEEVIPVVTITKNEKGREVSRTTSFMKVKRKPNIREKQISIDALYKRFGNYAPTKLFGAFGKVNEEGELENVQRFAILSNGEKIPLPG